MHGPRQPVEGLVRHDLVQVAGRIADQHGTALILLAGNLNTGVVASRLGVPLGNLPDGLRKGETHGVVVQQGQPQDNGGVRVLIQNGGHQCFDLRVLFVLLVIGIQQNDGMLATVGARENEFHAGLQRKTVLLRSKLAAAACVQPLHLFDKGVHQVVFVDLGSQQLLRQHGGSRVHVQFSKVGTARRLQHELTVLLHGVGYNTAVSLLPDDSFSYRSSTFKIPVWYALGLSC